MLQSLGKKQCSAFQDSHAAASEHVEQDTQAGSMTRQACGVGLAVGDDSGDAGPTVTLLLTIGEPLTGTETLPDTVPGGGGGELGCGGGCSKHRSL